MEQNTQSLFLSTLTGPQLRTLFRSEIESYFKENPIGKQSPALDQDIIEIDEASNITKYSKSAIYKYLQRGEMPCIRSTGRKILFSKKALHEWLKQGRKLTLSEIQRQSEREPSPTP